MAFQIQDLCRQPCDADIRKAISSLPRDLPETYNRILRRILQEGKAEVVERVFCWLGAVKRPLLLQELREAIAVQPGDEFLRKDQLVNDPDAIITWCGSLVSLDEEDLLVQFAHHSVKQFLLSESLDKSTARFHYKPFDADILAGEVCTTYLHFNDFKRDIWLPPKRSRPIQPKDIAGAMTMGDNRLAKYVLRLATFKAGYQDAAETKHESAVLELTHMYGGGSPVGPLDLLQTQYSFLAYAREFWLSHTAYFTPRGNHLRELWKQLVSAENLLAIKPWTSKKGQTSKIAIVQYILTEKHLTLLTCLEDLGLVPDDVLFEASRRGDSKFFDFLIGRNRYLGGNINAAFLAAARAGDIHILENLLLAGVKVDSQGKTGNSCHNALYAASLEGNEAVVKLLFERGADINNRCGQYGTALHAASAYGHEKTVKMLLLYGANVNAPGWPMSTDLSAPGTTGTALYEAAGHGHEKVVKILLDAGADVNAHDGGQFGTALQAAKQSGNKAIAKLLLDRGADPNAYRAYLNGAIQTASKAGSEALVKLLLNRGADINSQDGFSGTALTNAVEKGHQGTVELLLDRGADVNLRTLDSHETALQIATRKGDKPLTKLLINKGAVQS